MSDRAAFLQAIIAAPEDDGLRLVYADWLDEQGSEADSARAQFIRLQIEASRLSANEERLFTLADEARSGARPMRSVRRTVSGTRLLTVNLMREMQVDL